MTEHKMDIEIVVGGVSMTGEEFHAWLDRPRTLRERLAAPRYWWPRFRDGLWFDFRQRCQRFMRRHADEDLWSMNYALARLIVAGTSGMLEWGHGHPAGMTPEEWDDILRDIRDGFDIWMERDGWIVLPFEREQFKRAAGLLAEHFDALWD